MAKNPESDHTKHSSAEEQKPFDWFAATFSHNDQSEGGIVSHIGPNLIQTADKLWNDVQRNFNTKDVTPTKSRDQGDVFYDVYGNSQDLGQHAKTTSDGKNPALGRHVGKDSGVSGPITYNIPELKSISVFDKAILSGDLKTLKTEVGKYHSGAHEENELEWMMQKVHRDMAEHNIYVNTREVGVKIPGSKYNDMEQEISITAKTASGHDSKMVSLVSEKSQLPEVKTPLGRGLDGSPQVYIPSKEDPSKALAEIIAQAKASH